MERFLRALFCLGTVTSLANGISEKNPFIATGLLLLSAFLLYSAINYGCATTGTP